MRMTVPIFVSGQMPTTQGDEDDEQIDKTGSHTGGGTHTWRTRSNFCRRGGSPWRLCATGGTDAGLHHAGELSRQWQQVRLQRPQPSSGAAHGNPHAHAASRLSLACRQLELAARSLGVGEWLLEFPLVSSKLSSRTGTAKP